MVTTTETVKKCARAAWLAALGWMALVLGGIGQARAGTPLWHNLYLEPDAQAKILATPVAGQWAGAGFMPVRVRIENDADVTRSWGLTFTVTPDFRSGTQHGVRMEVPAREVVERVVFVPGNQRMNDGSPAWVNVKVDGPGASGSTTQIVNRGPAGAVVTAVSAAQESALFVATNGAPGPKAEISVVDAAAWPADWRTWAPFDRVVMTEAEFARMDGARRAALCDWVALGGLLDLYLEAGVQTAAAARDEPSGLGWVRRSGLTIEADGDAKRAFAAPTSEVRAAGPAELTEARWAELELTGGKRGVLVFLLLFGLLIGPVNLFVLAPPTKRHRLFVTVPAISLAASALLAGYILVKDGFGGEGSQRGVVVLLPAGNQAVVAQEQAARTGVLVGRSFALADEVALTQTRHGTEVPGGATKREYVRTGGEAGGDWFKSRRLQGQMLRQVVSTRARVERVDEGGPVPVVQSSVGTMLRDFQYKDGRGGCWRAQEVPPGARVTLQKDERPGAENWRTGTFRAYGGAAEGLAPIPTLESIRWDEPVFLYAGPVLEGGAR